MWVTRMPASRSARRAASECTTLRLRFAKEEVGEHFGRASGGAPGNDRRRPARGRLRSRGRSATKQPPSSERASEPRGNRKNGQSRPVSRVLFRRVVAFPAAADIPLGPALPPTSSGLPGSAAGHRIAPLCALAPGGACRAARVATGAVRSCRTVSPLPALAGGLFSVALSRESPRLAVSQHPALWSPDFPPAPFKAPASVRTALTDCNPRMREGADQFSAFPRRWPGWTSRPPGRSPRAGRAAARSARTRAAGAAPPRAAASGPYGGPRTRP